MLNYLTYERKANHYKYIHGLLFILVHVRQVKMSPCKKGLD